MRSEMIVALCMLTFGCVAHANAQYLTPSSVQLVSNDKKLVTVSGLLILNRGQHYIFESGELYERFSRELRSGREVDFQAFDRFCLTVTGSIELLERLERRNGEVVVVSGVYDASYGRENVDFGSCGAGGAINITDIQVR
jgi:hypothetical protein